MTNLISVRAAQAGLAFTQRTSGDLPDQIHGDERVIRQVLLNLLANAVKFTPEGGRILVSSTADDKSVSIHVADTGPGVPRDKHEAVFEPFVQLDRALTRTTDGTGLGLAISRGLARGMGGDVTLQSEVGAGSTFTLTLPLAPGRAGQTQDLGTRAD